MKAVSGLFLIAAVLGLGACSPSSPQPKVPDKPRVAVAAMAKPDIDEPPPVFDAEGNELEPELADAVREKAASERLAPAGEYEDDPGAAPADAPADGGT